jgi:alpha-ketoglutarate-dependent taurine dioxygenase
LVITHASIHDHGRRVTVTFADGVAREFAAPWLFDHADEARDVTSGQRHQPASALDGDVAIDAAKADGDVLHLRFSRLGAERTILVSRLRPATLQEGPAMDLWETPRTIAQAPPIPFSAYLGDDGALREALTRVARWGLAVLSGAGADSSAVERAVARFGFIRETNYGRTFDVRIEAEPGNLAYTDRGLDLHTDNPYRDPVPTLQLLHAIVVDEGGGESLFADGFAHAEALRREAPASFEILARTPARFTFVAGSGARWSHASPVLSLDVLGAVEAVRLNHRSLDLEPGDAAATEAWYEAYLALSRRAHAPGAIFGHRLAPGDMILFDNRRILHGRRKLTRETSRWLRGCYADVDGLAATLARLDGAGLEMQGDRQLRG